MVFAAFVIVLPHRIILEAGVQCTKNNFEGAFHARGALVSPWTSPYRDSSGPSPNFGEGGVASDQEAEQGEARTHHTPTLKCTPIRSGFFG